MKHKTVAIVDWIVKTACESSATGSWSVCTDDICREFGISGYEYISILGCVIEELYKRPEIVDVANAGNGTLDLELDTDFCEKFKDRRYEYRNGELKKKN